MINNRGKNFHYRRYFFETQKILNDMFSCLRSLKSTCSISADFINQFIIFEGAIERISKNTTLYTNFRPVFNIASEITERRHEILKDTRKIEKFCGNFKNCPVGIKSFRSEFKKICDDYGEISKNIGSAWNVNIFFLKLMTECNNFSVSLIQNAMKYRICPQLRLISEYCAIISRKENIKIKDILNSVK